MTYLILFLLIPLAANFITEWSGIIDTIKHWLFYCKYTKQTKYRFFRLKPFDCNLCLGAHITWIYLVVIGGFTIFEIILLALAVGSISMMIGKFVARYL